MEADIRLLENGIAKVSKDSGREVIVRIFNDIRADLRDLRSDVNNHSKRILALEKELKERKDQASDSAKRCKILNDPAPIYYSVDAEKQAAHAKITKPSLQRWSWSTVKQRYVHVKRASVYEDYIEDPQCKCDVCLNGALHDQVQKSLEIVIELD